MYWPGLKRRPSVLQSFWCCDMTYKKYLLTISSLGLALTLASSASSGTIGSSGGARGGKSASTHSTFQRSVANTLQRRRESNTGFWPTGSGFFYGSSNSEPKADVAPSISGDVHYSYTYEPLWDAAHRYPPAVSPSEPIVVRSYAPGCPTQTVTIPMGDGKEQSINIVRCY